MQKAVKALRESSSPRKFEQSVELIINLKDINLKKTEEQVEFFLNLPHQAGKTVRVCALIGHDLEDKAKGVCERVILESEFSKIDKKQLKKLAQDHDYFIAQADIMPKVAATFGRVLGPRNKMPNPKAGCIVPPKGLIQPIYDKLQHILRVSAKKVPIMQLRVGKEKMGDDVLVENIMYVISHTVEHLPREHHNIRSILLKTTMGKPVRVE